MQIAVLGPLEVRDDAGRPVDVAGARLRTLLTRLAVDAGRPVGVTTLVDAVWGDRPPAEETNALQTLVSRLRRLLGTSVILAAPGGYRLVVAPDDIDAHRFERLAADGSDALRAGDPATARTRLTEALGLWRGPALADAPGDALAPHAARLEDRRLQALVERIEADLALADPSAVVPELEALVVDHPLHERLNAQLVQALAASGRPADALGAYERVRARLADELGVDPSAELQELHLRLLRGEVTAAVRPAGPRRTNLKSQLTSFVGREDEVARIGKSLEQNRLVTLVGPGGAGKTRLANEAAARVIDAAADGVWLVELAPVTSGADVPQAVLSSIGLHDVNLIERRGKVSNRDAHSRLLDGLADKHVVLILDNCEHLIEAGARLADLLLAECPGLRVLATSREPLGIVGEVLLPVPPLGQPNPTATAADALEYPAVRLFADRAASVRPDFAVDATTVATVIDIVRRLDGLPLAIELAAARLRSLALVDVAERLSDRFRLLTGGSRTALPRHRTLRAVVEWSWDLLTDTERLLVEQLSVFPSGVTVTSATAISDADPEDVPDLLASLIDKSLLQPVGDGRRMRMLETIREYGTERLAERGDLAAMRARHADHFAALMADAEPHLLGADQLPWFEALRAERENVVAALRYLCDIGDVDGALTLGISLSGYGMMLGLNDEINVWMGDVLAVPGPDSPARALAETIAAMTVAATGESRAVVASGLRELAVLAGKLRDVGPEVSRLVHVVRPVAAYFSDQYELAEEYLAQTLATADDWSRGAALTLRSALAENDGDVERMRADAEAALEIFRRLGERWGLASSLRGLGQLHALDGDLDEAVACYRESMRLTAELHSRDDEGFLLGRLAELELRRGDVEAARAFVIRARRSAEENGAPMEAAFGLAMLAAVEWASGNVEAARTLQQEAFTRVDSLPTEHPAQGHIRAVVLSLAVRIAFQDGDVERAWRLGREARTVAVGTRDMPLIASVGVNLAEIVGAGGDAARGARMLGAAARLRGAEDHTAIEVVRTTAGLRDALGNDAFAVEFEAGRRLDRDAALAVLDLDAT